MGLLDRLLGGLMQGGMQGGTQAGLPGAGRNNQLLEIVLQMVQQNGGLSGLLQKMQQTGYGSQAQSWIGTGSNQPIGPDVLSQIFGQGNLGQIAQQLGMSQEDVASNLSRALPEVVDRMTPEGHIPDDQDDLVTRTLEDLRRGGNR